MLRRRGDDPGGRRALPEPRDRARRTSTRSRSSRSTTSDDVERVLEQMHLGPLPPPRSRSRAGVRAHVPRRRPRARQRDHACSTSRTRARRSASSSPATSGRARHARSCATPRCPSGATCCITESTYGDRLHPTASRRWTTSSPRVRRSAPIARGGKVVIPSFALERAQEVIFALKQLRRAGAHPADAGLRRLAAHREDHRRLPAAPRVLRRRDARAAARAATRRSSSTACATSPTVEESQGDRRERRAVRSSSRRAACARPAASCTTCKATVEDPKNTVLIVGFQAQHTLGRRIVERRPRVRIFGVERDAARRGRGARTASARTPTSATSSRSPRRCASAGRCAGRPGARRARGADALQALLEARLHERARARAGRTSGGLAEGCYQITWTP